MADIPFEIQNFFLSLYDEEPNVSQKGKVIEYFVPGKEVSIIKDPYSGCHINIGAVLPEEYTSTQNAIETLEESLKKNQSFDSLWIDIQLPTNAFGVIPPSFQIGNPNQCDLIHDHLQNKIRVWKWLNDSKVSTIPPGPTHNIGATALVIDKLARKVLLVENVQRQGTWNLPGGSFDLHQDKEVSDTAKREFQEETGIQIDTFPAPELIGQMHFPTNQFAQAINQVWAYFIDYASTANLNPPADEVKQAKWLSIDDIMESKEATIEGLKLGSEIKSFIIAAMNQRGSKEIARNEWMVVHAPVVQEENDKVPFAEISSLNALLNELNSPLKDGEWGILALDLDQTLIQSKTTLGNEHFYQFLQQQNKNQGIDQDAHYSWVTKIRGEIPYETCEPVEIINEILQNFRQQGWTVRILTSRGLEMKEMTGRHLQESGLDISVDDVIFKERASEDNHFYKKDESLMRWMDSQPEQSSSSQMRIVFADDLKKYCSEVARIADKMEKASVKILNYTYALPSPSLSENQMKQLVVQLDAYKRNEALPVDFTEDSFQQAKDNLGIQNVNPQALYQIIREVAQENGFPFE